MRRHRNKFSLAFIAIVRSVAPTNARRELRFLHFSVKAYIDKNLYLYDEPAYMLAHKLLYNSFDADFN